MMPLPENYYYKLKKKSINLSFQFRYFPKFFKKSSSKKGDQYSLRIATNIEPRTSNRLNSVHSNSYIHRDHSTLLRLKIQIHV